jgi:hypothetical protein
LKFANDNYSSRTWGGISVRARRKKYDNTFKQTATQSERDLFIASIKRIAQHRKIPCEELYGVSMFILKLLSTIVLYKQMIWNVTTS